MPNSEDYLDGLLNSISSAKSEVDNATMEENLRQHEKIANRNKIDANDDFLSATGLSDFQASPVGRDNVNRVFSEADFLADFEDEINNGTADDFIRQFELELDEEEAEYMHEVEMTQEAAEELPASDADVATAETEPAVPESSDDVSGSSNDDIISDLADLTGLIDNAREGVEADALIPGDDIPIETAQEPIEDEADEAVDDETEQTVEAEASESSDDNAEPVIDPELLNILDTVENVVAGEDVPVEGPDAEASTEAADGDDSASSADGVDDLGLENLTEDDLEINEDGIPLLDENADIDLETLLADDEGDLGGIGDLLNADEADEELPEARDEFEESANAVEADTPSLDDFDEAEKSGGFAAIIEKIKGIFSKKKKTEEPEEKVDISAPPQDDLNAENQQILDELSEEDKAVAPEDDKAAKKAAKKEAKAARKAEKAAAKAAKKGEAATKEKKPSKIKEFFANDTSKKTPPKLILIFIILAASIVAAVLVFSKVIAPKSQLDKSKSYYNKGDYINAYAVINGGEYADKYQDYVMGTRMLADLQQNYKEYDLFMSLNQYDQALDALIKGYARYSNNREDAEKHGVADLYDRIGQQLEGQLKDEFGVEPKDALELYDLDNRKKYSKEIYFILKDLKMVDK